MASSLAPSGHHMEQHLADFLETGTVYEYFKGEFDTLPDFNTLPGSHSQGLMNQISINGTSEFIQFDKSLQGLSRSGEAGNFAIRFTALLRVPHAGLWTFYLTSNDGSALYLAGKKVVQHDGLHYATEKEGRIRIRAPGMYPLTVLYFHKNGKLLEGVRSGPTLSLSYYFPGSGWLPYPPDYVAKQTIPASSLFYNPYDDKVVQVLRQNSSSRGSHGDESHDNDPGLNTDSKLNEDYTQALESDIREASSKMYNNFYYFKTHPLFLFLVESQKR